MKKKKRRAVKRPLKPARAGKCCVSVMFAGKDVMDLDNTYRDVLQVTVTARKRGSVVLTGSGVAQATSAAGTPWAWVQISIGPVSGGSNNGNETTVEFPNMPGGGVAVRYPFSLTAVVPMAPGTRSFYLVAIKDPNPNNWSLMFPKLTAMFVES